jgi:glycosyltransferase involved in cell wall biosynthesis
MLARAWKENGNEVVFFNFDQQYPKLLFPGKNQIDNSLDEHEFTNYRIITPWMPLSWKKATDAIADYQPDKVVFSWFLPFFAPAYYYIMRKLPLTSKVILAHNVATHEKWLLGNLLSKAVFSQANEIVVLSKSSMNELNKVYPLSIYNKACLGFHPIYSNYADKAEENSGACDTLLFFGLIKPYKGLDVLLDAMPRVHSAIPKLKLVIAGEVYGDIENYNKQIYDLGIQNAVEAHFRYISDDEVAQFFSRSSLCVLPYKSASQSGVIATAYSFGVPVLASDVGGLGEYVIAGETGYLVKPNDPISLADAIIRFFSNKPDMKPAIMKYNKRHSWDSLASLIAGCSADKPGTKRKSKTAELKKLLLISYYFPPCGGAAVQRWLRFIDALDKRGVQVTVITTKDGDYPYRDESLVAKLPQSIKVLRSKPLGFGALWRMFGNKELPYGSLKTNNADSTFKRVVYWLRLNLVVPDMRLGWNRSAYQMAEKELMTNNYDMLITTGPPHSTHLVGLKLKDRFGVRWCTDFRDPWSEIYYLKLSPPSQVTMMLHRYLEKKVISRADVNYIVSSGIAKTLPPGNKVILYNGYNPQDFADKSYLISDRFRIKYVGQLTAGQNPKPLFDALEGLKTLERVELSFIGTREIPSSSMNIKQLPFCKHDAAIDEMVNAELLVLIINNYPGNEGMLTTKLFEYIASRTPILCLAEPGGEAESIISQSDSGLTCNDVNQISEYISHLYELWQQGKPLRCSGDIAFIDVNRQIDHILKSFTSNQ